MDPDANLQEQLEIAHRIIDEDDESIVDYNDLIRLTNRLAELVVALDEWISVGGFKPNKWS